MSKSLVLSTNINSIKDIEQSIISYKYQVGNTIAQMFNKTNNNVVMATVKTINQNKYMITSVLIAGIVLLAIGQIIKANGFESFISYSDLGKNQTHQSYLGYHIPDRFVWYKNNNENGFNLDAVLSDEQQALWDSQSVEEQNPQLIKAALNFYLPAEQ